MNNSLQKINDFNLTFSTNYQVTEEGFVDTDRIQKRRKDTYIGEHDLEEKRLEKKARVERFVKTYLKDHLTHFTPGMKTLDVGGASGYMVEEIARDFPLLNSVNFDNSDARSATAARRFQKVPNAIAIKGNAFRLPFPDHSFDLVFSRFLLQHVSDQEQVIREMVRVCKKGGRVLLQDTDRYGVNHFPKEERMEEILNKVLTTFNGKGFDPESGRKLFSYCKQANLQEIQLQMESHNVIAGKISGEDLDFYQMELRSLTAALEDAFGNDKEEVERVKEYLLDFKLREDTISFANLFTVTGTKEG